MISEKNILKTDLEQILQGNTCYTIALYVREKRSIIRGLGEKILTQTHEITHTPLKVKWPAPNYMYKILLPSDIALATPIFDSALSVY